MRLLGPSCFHVCKSCTLSGDVRIRSVGTLFSMFWMCTCSLEQSSFWRHWECATSSETLCLEPPSAHPAILHGSTCCGLARACLALVIALLWQLTAAWAHLLSYMKVMSSSGEFRVCRGWFESECFRKKEHSPSVSKDCCAQDCLLHI